MVPAPIPNVRFECPPSWMSAALTRAVAKFLWSLRCALRYPTRPLHGLSHFSGGGVGAADCACSIVLPAIRIRRARWSSKAAAGMPRIRCSRRFSAVATRRACRLRGGARVRLGRGPTLGEVVKALPATRAVMIGDGPDAEALKSQARAADRLEPAVARQALRCRATSCAVSSVDADWHTHLRALIAEPRTPGLVSSAS
jgi:hypothetical protein